MADHGLTQHHPPRLPPRQADDLDPVSRVQHFALAALHPDALSTTLDPKSTPRLLVEHHAGHPHPPVRACS